MPDETNGVNNAVKCILSIVRIEATLFHYPRQLVHRLCITMLIETALQGRKLGKNRVRDDWILTPNELDLTFWAPNNGAKCH